MSQRDQDFAAKLLATFKEEAQEHLQSLNEGFLKLEHPSDIIDLKEIINVIFRGAHSLKGGARAVALLPIEKICQALENVLSEWREKPETFKPTSFDVLYETLDLIDRSIALPEISHLEELSPKIDEMIQKLETIQGKSTTASPYPLPPTPVSPYTPSSAPISKNSSPPPTAEANPCDETVESSNAPSLTLRISVCKLDKLLQQIEEILLIKLSEEHHFKSLKDLEKQIENWQKEWQRIQPEIHRLRVILNHSSFSPLISTNASQKILNFFDIQNESFKHTSESFNRLMSTSMQDLRMTSGMIDGLLEETKKVLMLPLSTLLQPFPRMVRDIAHSLGKEVQFEILGGEIEIDRRILEELKDPLIHLVRNSIDHGIELKEQRLNLKKPPSGKIIVSATQTSGNQVEIAVSDDGEGIQLEKIKQTALKRKLFSEQHLAQLSDQDLLKLIFHAGFSTSPIITEFSGRGVGMEIVSQKMEKLGGKVLIQTTPGKGTTFTLQFPLSLATFRGIHLKLFNNEYMISTQNVKKVVKLNVQDLHQVERQWMFDFKGEAIPYIPLSQILKFSVPNNEQEAFLPFAIIIESNEGIVAIGVGQILGEQEVFVKSTGKQIKHLKNISSATILEQGTVVPILDSLDLIRSALATKVLMEPVSEETSPLVPTQPRILIAEDSVTARTLLKNILEAAGYNIQTAVDGAEAYDRLKNEKFDLLLSDVEMPRMNGFELTEKIRTTKSMESLPIILCTSRGSKEDREHGIDVGANAYLDKSSFAQSNLLDIIQKLL